MPRLGTSAATDFNHVDGVETVTLTRDATSITVEKANRGYLSAGDQVSGMDPGASIWMLPVVEVTGGITFPTASDTITTSDSEVFVIVNAQKLILSQMWRCLCRVGLEVS